MHCDPNESCVIEVHDKGVGFSLGDPEVQQRMKTNVGVETTRLRIEQIGGSMHVESTPGEGTKVRLKIPMVGHNSERNSNFREF